MATGGQNQTNAFGGVPSTIASGGGNPSPQAPAPLGPQASAPPQFNVNTASAQGLQGAMGATAQGTGYQAPQLGQTDLQQYQNPYQQHVIDNTLGDMNRARQMTMNDVGASASAANAFGGSRHGLVESETNRNFADQAGNMSAQLNQAGYNNAQGAAQFDINNSMQAQGMRQNAASSLAGMSGQAFGMGQQINDNMMQAGSQQQALQQQLINAAQSQFQGWAGAPQNALNLPLAALGATPNVGSQTQSQSPGLLNILSLGMGLL